MCELEKITGTICNEEGKWILSYKDKTYLLCSKHFAMVLPYADTKDDDSQSELDYQKESLINVLSSWEPPYRDTANDHWKMLMDKIEQLTATMFNRYNTEERINNLYKTNNTAEWAKNRLKILSEMLDENEPHICFPPKIEWIRKEVLEIMIGIETT